MNERKRFSLDWPVAAWKIRGRIDNVPLPSQEILNHTLEQQTLDFKNLALHVVTTLVVADTIITAINEHNKQVAPEKRIQIDRDTTLETMVAYHASRPLADAGAKGESTKFINEYMKAHQDTELAELIAIQKHFPLSIIESIEEYTKARGYPEKTIGPENPQRPGTIDWNVAITQIASWSVAGTIVPIDKRFEDLIARHANTPDSPKKTTKEEWLKLQKWGEARLKQLCDFLGIEQSNFYDWLRSHTQLNSSPEQARQESDNSIRELFQREPVDNEFLPVSPAYRYLTRSILNIKPGLNPQRKTIERLLARPERFLHLCQVYGLVQKDNKDYKSVKT